MSYLAREGKYGNFSAKELLKFEAGWHTNSTTFILLLLVNSVTVIYCSYVLGDLGLLIIYLSTLKR